MPPAVLVAVDAVPIVVVARALRPGLERVRPPAATAAPTNARGLVGLVVLTVGLQAASAPATPAGARLL